MDGTPPRAYGPYIRKPPVKYSVGFLGVATTVLLGLDALFALGSIAGLSWRVWLLNRRLAGSGPVAQSSVDAADALVRIADALLLRTVLGTAVVFLCWFWVARKNAEAYAPGRGGMAVGWSLGGWFVPVANLVIPCIAARDVYRGTMSGHRRKRPDGGGLITGWWWASVVVAWVPMMNVSAGSSIAYEAEEEGPHQYLLAMRDLSGDGLLALAVLVISAVLAICYVQTITKVQRQRNAAGDWAGGPGRGYAKYWYEDGDAPPVPAQDQLPVDHTPVFDAVQRAAMMRPAEPAPRADTTPAQTVERDDDPFAPPPEKPTPPS